MNKMILRLYLLFYFCGTVLNFHNDTEEITNRKIEDPDLEHFVDIARSADKLFAEGRSKNIILHLFLSKNQPFSKKLAGVSLGFQNCGCRL